MAQPGLSRANEQINVVLPFPLAQAVGADVITALESADRVTRREALAAIEYLEAPPIAQQEELASRICRQISTTTGLESVSAQEPREGFLSIDNIDPIIGPPEGVPILNPHTGILSIYPPSGAEIEQAASAVREAVAGQDGVHGIEPVPICRAVNAFGPYSGRPERAVVAYRTERTVARARDEASFENGEEEEVWLEAALQAGSAGETLPWGIGHIGATAAWQRGYEGQGVLVAVIDTGIAPHIDLLPPVRGATFIPGSTSFYDDHGHGTHVAGTIAARRGNGVGVVGVAPKARLLAVKVLARDGYSRGDSVAQGITWAANNGARVINLSLSTAVNSMSMYRAVLYARSRGVVVCAAAGNDMGGPVSYPAAFNDACIAVAASDKANRRADFSNRGPELDIAAPGVQILSASLANSYRKLNGTSMATPHVTGVSALVLSRDPGLSPLAVQRHLERTAMPAGSRVDYGSGIVQADRAVAVPAIVASPPSPTARIEPMEEPQKLAPAPRRPARGGKKG